MKKAIDLTAGNQVKADELEQMLINFAVRVINLTTRLQRHLQANTSRDRF
jgi:hypothetical protein